MKVYRYNLDKKLFPSPFRNSVLYSYLCSASLKAKVTCYIKKDYPVCWKVGRLFLADITCWFPIQPLSRDINSYRKVTMPCSNQSNFLAITLILKIRFVLNYFARLCCYSGFKDRQLLMKLFDVVLHIAANLRTITWRTSPFILIAVTYLRQIWDMVNLKGCSMRWIFGHINLSRT